MTNEPPLLDSEEGATILIEWARKTGAVLNAFHRTLAEKYAVPVDGVRFSGPLASIDPLPWAVDVRGLAIRWHCGLVGTHEGFRPMTRDELDKMNG